MESAQSTAAPRKRTRPGRTGAASMLNKVTEVTLYFWIVKVLAPTVGETAADFLNTNPNLGLTGTTFAMSGVLAVAPVAATH